MRARGYLLALVAMTLAQACVLVGVYGSRLADLNVPLTFAWTDPPASSELWRPNYTLSDPPQTPNSAASFTQTDTMLALSGATLLKNGTWYSGDGRLAAPGVSSQLDFPAPLERGDISFGLAIGLVAATPAALANLFLLASFLAVLWVAAAFLWAWRPGSRWLVPLAALAIANAPYHFVRENFFAANYVLVVPTVACCVLLARRRDLGRPGRIAVVAWVVAVPFFGLYSAITALVLASWTTLGMLFIGWRRSGGRARRALVATGWLWAWTSAWLLIDLLPTMSYWAEHGSVATLERTVAVSDKYALRLLDLVTQPDTLLASPLLRRSSWLATAEFKGEGVVVGGFIGLATFALLLWWLATTGTGLVGPVARLADAMGHAWTGTTYALLVGALFLAAAAYVARSRPSLAAAWLGLAGLVLIALVGWNQLFPGPEWGGFTITDIARAGSVLLLAGAVWLLVRLRSLPLLLAAFDVREAFAISGVLVLILQGSFAADPFGALFGFAGIGLVFFGVVWGFLTSGAHSSVTGLAGLGRTAVLLAYAVLSTSLLAWGLVTGAGGVSTLSGQFGQMGSNVLGSTLLLALLAARPGSERVTN